MESGHSDTTTHGIRVRVAAEFLPEHSNVDEDLHVYAYRVIISNEGDQPAQLLTRHWVIRDANNELREVSGPGVVGQQPNLAPGESFEYTSHCPLPTSWGTMEGRYGMRRDDGFKFDADVGRFFLARTVAPLTEL